MTTALAATHRVDLQYTVATFPHHFHVFCHVTPGSGASGYDMDNSNVGAGVDTRTAINDMVDYFANLLNTACTLDSSKLEARVGLNWVPLDVFNPTQAAGLASGAIYPAQQMTMTFRDSAYHKVKFVTLEGWVQPGEKFNTPAAFPGFLTSFIHQWTLPGTGGHISPWDWVRGRSGLYLASYTSTTTDLNDKIRRRRHLT